MQMSDSDQEVLLSSSPSSRPGRLGKAGMVMGALGLVGVAGFVGGRFGSMGAAPVASLMQAEDRVDIEPSAAACSTATEDCASTGCCKVTGHKCFTKKMGARCNETCTEGGKDGYTCNVVSQASVPVSHPLGGSLYCFSVAVKETGSTKENTEPQLISMQKRLGVSIFACEENDVFSDSAEALGDVQPIQVFDILGEFHMVKRQDAEEAGWVNWGLFYQVWLGVRESGKWQRADWTVKTDPDAVFVPQRLREYLPSKVSGESPHGLYLENCKNVNSGFFGNIEVMSQEATRVMTTYLENCHADFAPCANDGCDWKFGPWGEDVFAQRCMDHHYVDRVEAFDLTTDGACAANRPADEKTNKKWKAEDCSVLSTPAAHPYKKPDEYVKCLNEMTGQQYTI